MAFTESFRIKAIDQFSRVNRNFRSQIEKNSKNIKRFTANLDKAKFAFTAFAGAIALGFTASVVSAAKFEKGITNVFTLLDKPQIQQFGGQLEMAQRNAVRMGFAIGDANKALFDTVSALGAGEQANKTFNIATKLAIGGQAELRVAVDGLTSVVNAYGKETTDATLVANAFFSSQRAGKTTVAELASNVGKIAPIAKQAGVGFKTLLATMSQLTLGGLKTEEATTALRGAIGSLIKPAAESMKVLKKHQIPTGAAALQNADFTEVLLKLAEAAREDADALALMIPEKRALTAIAAIGTKEVDNLRNIIKSINKDYKEGTGLIEAYAKNVKTLSQIFKAIVGSAKDMTAQFGKELFPILKPIGLQIIKLIRAFADLSPNVKKLILLIIGLAGAFAGVLALLGGLIAFKGTLIAIGAVLAAVSLPALAVVAALGAIGTVIVFWKDIAKAINDTVDAIDRLFEKITSFKGIGRGILKASLATFGLGRLADIRRPEIAPLPAGGEITTRAGLEANINVGLAKGVMGTFEKPKIFGADFADVGVNLSGAGI
jgi:TP901 family phage tail tape measure protein